MDGREQMQEQMQEQGKHTYENKDWIDVWDFQVSEHERQDGQGSWWDVKLASNTFIEHNGERLDVSKYHFSSNVEPSLTYGESGQPGAMRGIHFPDGWTLDLRRFSNTAPEGQPPVFTETGRIEGVTPKQIADGVRERNKEWKLSHRKAHPEQSPDKNQDRAQKAVEDRQKRAMEPSL